jgi:hypothetical protein
LQGEGDEGDSQLSREPTPQHSSKAAGGAIARARREAIEG